MTGNARKNIRKKSLRGELLAIKVSAGHARSRHQELSGHSHGRQMHVFVHDIGSQIGDGNADHAYGMGIQVAQANRPIRHMDGGLGNAVHIDQAGKLVAVSLEPRAQALHLKRFSPKNDRAKTKRGSCNAVGIDELTKCRRRLIENGNALCRAEFPESVGRARNVVRNHNQAAAVA